MPAKKGSKTAKRTPKKRSTAKKSSRKSAKARQEPSQSSLGLLWSGLTLDRKLDILGLSMVLLGLLTLLSILSSNTGWLSGGWLSIIGMSFGWGMYLLPVGLMALGLWLILRHFEQLPQLELSRLVGVFFFFLLFLGWLHWFSFPTGQAAIFDIAAQSTGGGYLGGALLAVLQPNLGRAGAALTLAAGTLLALAFLLDLSLPEMFSWLGPIFARLQTILDNIGAQISTQTQKLVRADSSVPIAVNHASMPTSPAETTSAPAGFVSPDEVDQRVEWILPAIDEILEAGGEMTFDDDFDLQRAHLIEETLASFGAPAKVVEINRGPTITQFGVEPGFIESRSGQMRVRVNKISALADDLALTLSAKRIRIQAPVPGKSFVGIEVPNDSVSLVALRAVLERTRGDLTVSTQQEKLRQALAEFEERVSNVTPE